MTTIYRIIKLGFSNFWRNGLLSMAATLILTVTLLTISLFVILVLVGNASIQSVNSRIDIIAYFEDTASEAQIMEIKDNVSNLTGVRKIDYISKEEAFGKWQGRTEDERLKKVITREDNPLPRSLEVKVSDPEQTESVANYFKKEEVKPLLHRVRYNKEVVEKLTRYTNLIKKAGLGLVSIFVVISVLVVFNTIRLAIYARRDEIDIMKLVGATSIFVRTPFLVEGVLFGIIAAIFSSLIFYLGGQWLAGGAVVPTDTLQEIYNFLGEDAIRYFSQHKFLIFIYQILAGILISLACSWVAIYKYLSFTKKS